MLYVADFSALTQQLWQKHLGKQDGVQKETVSDEQYAVTLGFSDRWFVSEPVRMRPISASRYRFGRF